MFVRAPSLPPPAPPNACVPLASPSWRPPKARLSLDGAALGMSREANLVLAAAAAAATAITLARTNFGEKVPARRERSAHKWFRPTAGEQLSKTNRDEDSNNNNNERGE